MEIKDPANPTEAELKHSPEIKIGADAQAGFALVVNIGQKELFIPSVANHWIYEIELQADGRKIKPVSLETWNAEAILQPVSIQKRLKYFLPYLSL